MKPTLVILAAGMASRYGSMKQVEAFGPSGETIMEYSIYDAIRAGFGKVVFIIREDFADDFKEIFEPKLKGKIAIGYVYQQLDAFLGNRAVPADRTKPWGTAHALLCCKDEVKEPFAIINADDFYGSDAFNKAYKFLTSDVNDKQYCIVGYELKRTLSDNGSVSRGVCEVDANSNLTNITERTKIFLNGNGSVSYEDEMGTHDLNINSIVSMNFFAFAPNVISVCEELFGDFLDKNINNPKGEFFIPLVVDEFVKSGKGAVKVVPTPAEWFGVTYKEDAPVVKNNINALIAGGAYPNNLWA
jgi:NDP-sugar pyrophosphorylase family protein